MVTVKAKPWHRLDFYHFQLLRKINYLHMIFSASVDLEITFSQGEGCCGINHSLVYWSYTRSWRWPNFLSQPAGRGGATDKHISWLLSAGVNTACGNFLYVLLVTEIDNRLARRSYKYLVAYSHPRTGNRSVVRTNNVRQLMWLQRKISESIHI